MSFVIFGKIAEKLEICAEKAISEGWCFKFFSKTAAVILSAAFCLSESAAYTPVKAVIVIDANKNKVIYEHNADEKTQPASLTKMMTLFLTFQALDQRKIRLNSKITVSQNAASQKPCKLGLKKGDKLTVHDAILAVVTKSANDASVALAEHIAGGSQERFVERMNQKAKSLGMKSTVFMNPSGWKNREQLTTARDMSKLALALYKKYPHYYKFFSTKTFSYCGRKYSNHNTLLGTRKDMIIDGIKTGFVNASGFNIVTSAVKGKQRVMLVYLGGESAQQRNRECNALFKKSFSRIQSEKIINKRRGSTYSSLHREIMRLLDKRATSPDIQTKNS